MSALPNHCVEIDLNAITEIVNKFLSYTTERYERENDDYETYRKNINNAIKVMTSVIEVGKKFIKNESDEESLKEVKKIRKMIIMLALEENVSLDEIVIEPLPFSFVRMVNEGGDFLSNHYMSEDTRFFMDIFQKNIEPLPFSKE